MKKEVFKIREQLKERLRPGRYEHSLSVSFTCMALAMRYGCDLDQAEMAGILHDCAKCYDNETIVKICEKQGLELTEGERRAPSVIHAKLGAYLARKTYGVEDQEILDAIACHTTGKPNMGLLDKILYVADYIEPRRDRAEALPAIRALAFQDLDLALCQIMEETLKYLEATGFQTDDMTRQACEYYRREKTNE